MPSLFGSKQSISADWLAVAVQPDRIDVARMEKRASGRPAVRICESIPSNGSQVEALSRLRKTLKPKGLRCTSLLGPGQYQMQLVEAPAVPSAEMRQAGGRRDHRRGSGAERRRRDRPCAVPLRGVGAQ